MKRRLLAMILVLSMCITMLPVGVMAEDGTGEIPEAEPTPVPTVEPTPTDGGAVEPTPTPAVCLCEQKCTEENINTLCPVCGAGGEAVSACVGEEAVLAVAEEVVRYPLWVDGEAVSSANAASLAEGKASYDAATNTLYLKGGIFNNSIKNSDGYPCILYYTGTETLTISVSGLNTISTLTNNGNWTGADGAYAIWSGGPLSFVGGGYLEARGGTGIYAAGSVTIGSNVHIAALSKVSAKAINSGASITFPYSEYDSEDQEYCFNAWRSSESELSFTRWAKSVTVGQYFEMCGSAHSLKRSDNGDGSTHKVACSCGLIYASAQAHTISGTSCSCGLRLAEVTMDGTTRSYISLADALNEAAAGGDAVVKLYSMTLTEDATLGAGDYLDLGLMYPNKETLTIADGVTLTLAAGSKLQLRQGSVVLEGSGRIVDEGCEIWGYWSNMDRQHTHSQTTVYSDIGETQHSKAVVCKNCLIHHVYTPATAENHSYNATTGLCACGAEKPAGQFCGDNLTWKLEDGVLTISGTGAMWDYESGGAPWYADRANITSVVLPDGLTSIGEYAFRSCSALESVTMAEGVTSIGSYAFENCKALKSIFIPASVKTINASSASSSPFYCCSSNLTIYCGADSVQDGWDDYWNYSSSGSPLTVKYGYSEMDYTYWLSLNKTAAYVRIPNGVTLIPEDAFYGCDTLVEIIIPTSVTSIGEFAFYDCDALKSVYIPATVTTIGRNAFSTWLDIYCEVTEKPAGWSASMGVSSSKTYFGCSETDYEYWTTLDRAQESIEIPDGIAVIPYQAFDNCDVIKSVIIPASVRNIGDYAFYNCYGLDYMYFKGEAPDFSGNSFYRSYFTAYYPAGDESWSADVRLSYGGGVTWKISSGTCGENLTWKLDENGKLTISGGGDMADFESCPWGGGFAREVSLPDSLTSISDRAFSGCYSLESIELPDSVESIGDSAFSGCYNLESVELSDSLESIGNHAFSGCDELKSIELPDGVTSIGENAFYHCSGLTSVKIPDGVTSIGNYAFSGCGSLASIELPSSVTSIGNHAFSDCDGLMSVEIPDGVTSIGDRAFYGCNGLENIEIPDSVTSIGEYAFYDCDGLENIKIPDSVTSIGNYAFSGCDGLTSVEIPDSVTSIGECAFYSCDRLTHVSFGSGVKTIGREAFEYCDALKNLEFKGNAPEVGKWAFYRVKAVASYPADNPTWTAEVRANFGSGNFVWVMPSVSGTCGDLEWLLDNNGTLIISGNGAIPDFAKPEDAPWYDCRESIVGVQIMDGVTAIGSNAFAGCGALGSVAIPGSVTSIGDGAFAGCAALEYVTFGGAAPEIGSGVFAGGTPAVYYPAEDESWTEDVLAELGNVTVLDPDYTGEISDGLYWVLTNGELTIYGVGAVENFSEYGSTRPPWYSYRDSITEITVMEGVTHLGSYAINDFANLRTINLPRSLSSMGKQWFPWDSYGGMTIYPIGVDVYHAGTVAQWAALGSKWPATCSDGLGGDCGEDLLWKLEGNTLTISGSGDMYDFDYDPAGVWSAYLSRVRTVNLGEGVRSVGEYAFYSCSNLRTLNLPTTLRTIGERAFYNCDSLLVVNIPSVESWLNIEFEPNGYDGNYAYGTNPCSNAASLYLNGSILTDIVVPESVTAIKPFAFYGYTALRNVKMHSGITSVGREAFRGCENATVDFAGTLSQWEAAGYNGVLTVHCSDATILGGGRFDGCGSCGYTLKWQIDANGKLVISGAGDMCLGSYGSAPWGGAGGVIRAIEIEEGVTSMAAGAVESLYSATSLVIPDSVEYIDNGAIRYGDLNTIVFEGSAPLVIGPQNFSNISAWVYYPANDPSWTETVRGQYEANLLIWMPYEDISDVALNPLTISGSKHELTSGEKLQLKATLTGVENASIWWSIDWDYEEYDQPAAWVDNKGLVTAQPVTEAQRVEIIAYADVEGGNGGHIQLRAAYPITVYPAVESVGIYDAAGTEVSAGTVAFDLNATDRLTLRASTAPAAASDTITWSCSDTRGTYADFTDNGDGSATLCNAKRTGTVTLTAKSANGKSAKVTVKLVRYATDIAIINAPEAMRGGAVLTLKHSLTADGTLTSKNVIWSVSDDSIPYAKIDAKGKLTTYAVSEPVTITVTVRSKENPAAYQSADITIHPAVRSVAVTLNGEPVAQNATVQMELFTGSVDFDTYSEPDDAIQRGTWTSSSKKVATIDENGVVTAVAPGTSTMTFKADDGSNKSFKVKVKVYKISTDLALTAPTEVVGGKSVTVKAALTAADGKIPTDKTVLWESSDTNVATVKNGKVSTKAVYENTNVTITATPRDGGAAAQSVTICVQPAKPDTLVIHYEGVNATGKTLSVDFDESDRGSLGASLYSKAGGVFSAAADVVWSSSNKKVADFDANGVLIFTGGSGKTTLTAKCGALSAKLTLNVVKRSANLSLTAVGEVVGGKAVTVTAALTASDGGVTTDKTLLWSSSNESVATVKNGKVSTKAVYENTYVTITAVPRDGGAAEQSVSILLKPAKAESLGILADGANVTAKTLTRDYDSPAPSLRAAVYSAELGGYSAASGVTWTSSNKKVATIDANGTLSYVGVGSTTITAKQGKTSVKFTLKLTRQVAEIVVASKTGTTNVISGKSLALTATVQPTNANSKKVIWASSDESVATVKNGKVTAKTVYSRKTVTITATAQDGSGAVGQITLTVLPLATTVSILSSDNKVLNNRTVTVSLAEVQSIQLSAKVYPAGAYGALQDVTWASSSKKVAGIDQSGLVTILKPGKTTIKITAADGSKKTTSFTLVVTE